MEPDEKLQLLRSDAEEIVTENELLALFESKRRPKAYIGFEPSGQLHIGNFLITARMIRKMLSCGFDFTILLADWHAYINDKLEGNLERIRACGRYMQAAFTYATEEVGTPRFVFASEMISNGDYLAALIRNAKLVSLSRLKRALTIMGRNEDEAELDFSKLIYPLMQVTDIFDLDVDVAYAGLDQRRAHMLARDIAEQSGRKKPIAIHTPIISSLKGGGRMDVLSKMSKSDPMNAIFIHDDEEKIAEKMRGAYCPPELDGNPVLDICKYIIMPEAGCVEILRDAKYGGDVTFDNFKELAEAYVAGRVHPLDLKKAAASGLWKVTKKYHDFFAAHASLMEWLEGAKVTR
ncbi:MAG: tyrosine--tRNA ligase [Methanomassiliicoccales archaeon]